MPVASLPDFQRLIEKSNLLAPEQLVDLRTWPEEEPNTLLARMVKAGWITDWQAQQLLAGKNQFFMGRYKLLDLIGQGGMGAVFKAVLPSVGRIVALKVMNRQQLKKPQSLTRFLREIRSAAAVDHPHLVRAYDADVDRDNHFLVMEYVAGQNLKALIKGEQPLPICWSCECIRQAALGLEHAFEQGMVHRDIKPSNLLVTQDEHSGLPVVKILDLGLARFASECEDDGDVTRSGQVLGTPDYIAPEQARNTKTADIRADIFSLGCTLFELLTCRLPFPGYTVMEKLMARASQDAFHVRQYRPDVPAELDAIVAKMLARDPDMRYTTPLEVAQALAPFASGTAGSVRAPQPGAASQAGLSTAGPPSVMFASLDPSTDTSLHGFPAELKEITRAKPARRAATSPFAMWHDRRVRTAIVMAGVILLLGLVSRVWPGKRGTPEDGTVHQTRASRIHHKGGSDEPEATEGDREPQGEINVERETALWVLERGGTVSVIAVGRHRAHSKKGSSVPPDESVGDSEAILDAGKLPAGAFYIAGVELHTGIWLSASEMARLAKLPRLESLDLADTRFADSEITSLKSAPSLIHLDLQDTPLSDVGLASLKNLTNLRSLQLSRTRISGTVLQNLTTLTELKELQLEGTPLRDRELRHLKELPHLTSLNLARTEVVGAWDGEIRGPSLQHVWRLKELTTLDLSRLHLQPNALTLPGRVEVPVRVLRLTGAKVSDDGLKHLSGLTSLRELSLGSTSVTDEGMKHLTWMAELEHLDVADTVVGDGGLKVMGALSSLKSLNLQGTIVSDAGLVHLRNLKGLQTLDLAGSKVTAAAVASLRQDLPACKVKY
jgi:tRNA A-37 threonylcarbamoyl transferase component Bud32/Leucine-rich repeat (LRR) protein